MDATMVRELVTSLQYIQSEIQDQKPSDITDAQALRLAAAIAHLEPCKKIHPAVFGSYYQFVMAAAEGAPTGEFVDVMFAASQWPCEFTIRNLDTQSLRDPRVLDIYLACLDTDPTMTLPFLTPAPAAAERTRDRIREALDLMEKAIPHLAEEFYGLVHEIVLASSATGKGEMRFDGASSYMLWGALFLNPDENKSVLEMLETLIHESSHSLLFGMCTEEALVKNDDEATFHSPLRPDPRPMDGIYHATYVSARMHYAIAEAIASAELDTAQRAEADSLLRSSYRAFRDGYQLVAEHGELTETGDRLMQEAHKYMSRSPYAKT
jgi:HEXXH motif-containing protein